MKLSTRRDVDVSPARVFAALSDFEGYERRARTRGGTVERLDDGTGGPASARWDARFVFRGRQRNARGRVVTYDPDKQIAIKAELDGIDGLFNIELLEIAPEATRMFVGIDLRPTTMTGRLLVQSLRLAKSTLTSRLDARLETFAKRLEKNARPPNA